MEAADSAAGLAKRIGIPRQKLNYHIRQLEKQGLVEEVGERKRRNCTERLVRAVARSNLISPATLGPLSADPDRIRDRTSSSYLVAVAARVINEVAELRERARKSRKKLPTLTLQASREAPLPPKGGKSGPRVIGSGLMGGSIPILGGWSGMWTGTVCACVMPSRGSQRRNEDTLACYNRCDLGRAR